MDEFVVDTGSDAPAQQLDPRRALILPLWRGRYLVLALMLLGTVGGVVAGVIRPNTYRSFGKLMIRAGLREDLSAENAVTGSSAGGMGGRSVVNDELHLLGTPEVVEAVARIVTPKELFRPYDPGADDNESTPAMVALFHRWQTSWFESAAVDPNRPSHPTDDCDLCVRAAAQAISHDLTMQAEPGADVITVSYSAHDPLLAQKVVAAFLEAAVAHHRKVYEVNTTLEILGSNLEQAQRDLLSAENDFTNFKSECLVYDFDNQQSTLIAEIHDKEGQVGTDQTRLEELRARTKTLKEQVAKLPESLDESTPHNLQANPRRSILTQRLFTLQDNLSALDARQGGTKEERELERGVITQQIDTAKAELAKEPEFVDSGPTIRKVPNTRRDRIVQELDTAQAELDGLEAAATVRAGQLANMRSKLQKMSECEPRFHALREAMLDARKRIDSISSQRERAGQIGSMDQVNVSNLRPIQSATLPNQKEGPLRGKLVVLGAMLGMVAGAGLAFARHMLDHRLHDAADVENVLQLPVLAIVPLQRKLSPRAGAPAT
ncbi:MAG: hypothetical protein IPJ19_18130 [Planctomycetes bacterium]|nr:hypothetical protein [Planctomycetota bacterium]